MIIPAKIFENKFTGFLGRKAEYYTIENNVLYIGYTHNKYFYCKLMHNESFFDDINLLIKQIQYRNEFEDLINK